MKSEENVWSGSPSQVVNMGSFIVLGLVAITIVGALIAVPWAIWKWLSVKNTTYQVTSQRLITNVGVLSKTGDELELYRVKDSRFEQPFFLRLFGLGNVVLVTNDATSPVITIKAVPNAKALREQIRNLVEARREQKQVRITELE